MEVKILIRRFPSMPFIPLHSKRDLQSQDPWPGAPAVFGVQDSHGNMIFIGQTDDLNNTLGQLRIDNNHCIRSYSEATGVVYELISDVGLRAQRYQDLVTEYKPPCTLRA
jgi:hypothetical protein